MKKFIYTIYVLLFTSSFGVFGIDPPLTEPAPYPPILLETPSDVMTPPPSYEYAFLKMVISLVILLVLIFLTVWALKRLSKGRLKYMNENLGIKILERRALSPKTMLYVVEVSGKKILMAESQLEIKSLTTIEEEQGLEQLENPHD